MIKFASENDFNEILEIYNYYVKNSTCTFDITPLKLEEIIKRININNCIIYENEENNKILGYAYYSKYNTREGYKNNVEISIYVNKDFRGKQIGNKLLNYLITLIKTNNYEKIISHISTPNDSSIKLHEKNGFVRCGILPNIGYKFGKYINVEIWILDIAIQ